MDATIARNATIRTISAPMRSSLATAITLAVLALLPATASAATETAPEPRGIPFSMNDLGWIALVAMLLLVLALVLQGIARHRRRSAAVRVTHQRTDP